MNIRKDDLITFNDDSKWLLLDIVMYKKNKYIFVNKITDSDEITDIYNIYLVNEENEEYSKLSDIDLENKLKIYFKENLQKLIDNIIY